MTKIYLVRYGEYSDQGIAGAFSTEEKAQKYCDVHNELEEYEDYWIDDYELDKDELSSEARVVTYYNVCVYKIFDEYTEAGEVYAEEEEKGIFTKPVIVEDKEDYIHVASTTSMEHAKKVAFDTYYKWKAAQEEVI